MSSSPWSGELAALASLFVRAVRTNLAYKSAIVLETLTLAVSYVVPMLVWRHVYAARSEPLAVPAGFLFPYLLLAAALNYCLFVGVEWRVGQRIRQGLIAIDLLRPVDFQLSQLSQSLADLTFNVVTVLPFIGLAYALWGSAALPHDLRCFAAFGVSAFLALLIQFSLAYIFVQTAFVTMSNYGIFVARSALQQTFSGISAPLALFPPTLRSVAGYLPFCHTIHTPVSIYLGAVPAAQIPGLLAIQAAWGLLLLWAGRALLDFSLRHVEIQGG